MIEVVWGINYRHSTSIISHSLNLMHQLSASSQYFVWHPRSIQNQILPILQNTLLVVIVIPCKFQGSLMYDFQNILN